MTLAFKDAVLLSVSGNPGTGNIVSAGAVSHYLDMVSGDDGKLFDITIYDCDSAGNLNGNVEVQIGSTFTFSTLTFTRTAANVLAGSSGAGSLVNFSSGTQRIAVSAWNSKRANDTTPAGIKLAVRAAAQGNLAFTRSGNTYTASSTGALLKATIDSGWSTGAALAVGDRLLLANQTSNVDNGIVTITNLGSVGVDAVLTRSSDMNVSDEVTSEMEVPVSEGTDANLNYKLSAAGPFTLNTTALPFTKAGGPPTGAAGGDLTGTYPNPTIASGRTLSGTTRSDAHYGTINADTDGSTITFDMSVSNLHSVTLGGNRILAVSNTNTGQTFSLRLKQDGTGSRTVTWFSGISWVGGSAPTLTTAINKADWYGFICTGAGAYDGFIIGQNI